MKWQQGDKYYIKGKLGDLSFTISKSMIYDKVIYELWNGNKWLYKSEKLEDAKAQAVQHYKEQSTSIGAEAK
jgi:hypothetical protein